MSHLFSQLNLTTTLDIPHVHACVLQAAFQLDSYTFLGDLNILLTRAFSSIL